MAIVIVIALFSFISILFFAPKIAFSTATERHLSPNAQTYVYIYRLNIENKTKTKKKDYKSGEFYACVELCE